MLEVTRLEVSVSVALRKEGVDRNISDMIVISFDVVALRKEGVDRNIVKKWVADVDNVALRKEGVDRNLFAD